MSHSAFHKRNQTSTPTDTPAKSSTKKDNQQPIFENQEYISTDQTESQPNPSSSQVASTHKETPNANAAEPFDDPFLMDSLNGGPMRKQSESSNKDALVGLLKESIAYFEQNNAIQRKLPNEIISNQTTTANSLNKSLECSHAFQKSNGNDTINVNDIKYLKNENLTLQLKYNELKLSNKKLLSDYSVMRSQIEDIKEMKKMYDNEIYNKDQKLKETELKLDHMTELYTREKIEKENNSAAFKSIIENMANNRNCSPSFERPTYSSQAYFPNNYNCSQYCADFNEELSSRIKKIEDELGDKEKELKVLKLNVSRQRMSPPLYTTKNISPLQNTSKMSFNEKGVCHSPPCSLHNPCKCFLDPDVDAQNQRTFIIPQKPKYTDMKFIAINKEDGLKPSPTTSPGLVRQTMAKSLMKKPKNAPQLNFKH